MFGWSKEGEFVAIHSGHLSCSIENEMRAGSRGRDVGGTEGGTEIVSWSEAVDCAMTIGERTWRIMNVVVIKLNMDQMERIRSIFKCECTEWNRRLP